MESDGQNRDHEEDRGQNPAMGFPELRGQIQDILAELIESPIHPVIGSIYSMVDRIHPAIDLIEFLIHLIEFLIHLIKFLIHLVESLIYLVEPLIDSGDGGVYFHVQTLKGLFHFLS